jgi:hypothetical protein
MHAAVLFSVLLFFAMFYFSAKATVQVRHGILKKKTEDHL